MSAKRIEYYIIVCQQDNKGSEMKINIYKVIWTSDCPCSCIILYCILVTGTSCHLVSKFLSVHRPITMLWWFPGCVYWPYPERNVPGGGTIQPGISDVRACILACAADSACNGVDYTITNQCWFITVEWNEGSLNMNTDVRHWREYQCDGRLPTNSAMVGYLVPVWW